MLGQPGSTSGGWQCLEGTVLEKERENVPEQNQKRRTYQGTITLWLNSQGRGGEKNREVLRGKARSSGKLKMIYRRRKRSPSGSDLFAKKRQKGAEC